MGMMVGRNNSNVVRIELKNWDGSSAGSISYTKPSPKKKKRLQYNFKAISAQIMATKTSGGASQVAARARRQTAMLQRSLKFSEYDDEEIKNAIAHAKSLERVAKKRVKHLRQEESMKRDENPYLSEMEDELEDFSMEGMDLEELLKMSEEELKQLMEELEQALQELEEEASAPDSMDTLSEIISEDMDSMDLEQLKKKHRADELREIMEADMKYLKALFDKLAREKQSAGSSSGSSPGSDTAAVSLELAGVAMPVTAATVPVAVEGANMDIMV